MDEIHIRHEKSANRFAVRLGNKIGYLSYEEVDENTLDYAHVWVPPEHRHQGIAAKLTQTALEYAREQGKTVVPSCPYVADYVERNPREKDVIKGEG